MNKLICLSLALAFASAFVDGQALSDETLLRDDKLALDDTGAAYGTRKFYFYSNGKDFHDATAECKKNRMRLVELRDYDIQTDFMKFLKEKAATLTNVWTAGNRLSGAWRWGAAGPNFDFEFWAPGEPNNLRGNQQCLASNARTSQWDDKECTQRLPYVCEEK